ncbi:MAG TPA: SHOCT domain-containing protein [Hanamia sp.]|nr:SHOCT domain-containing protein [Hanamia sp.]
MYLYYYFWRVSFIRWVIWILFIFWVFAILWGFYQRYRDTSYDILRKRFASGEITKEEYQEAKRGRGRNLHRQKF